MPFPIRQVLLPMLMAVNMASAAPTAGPPESATSIPANLQSLLRKSAAVRSMRADMAMTERQGQSESASTGTITVSRDMGFAIAQFRDGVEIRTVSDFPGRTHYQVFPAERKAVKIAADRPELVALFRRAAADVIRPLDMLDPATLTELGPETLAGEPVRRVAGTTVTRLVEEGAPVRRDLEAWLAESDGLPRKTIEAVEGGGFATTVYSRVVADPPVDAAMFRFTAPASYEVIDPTKATPAPGGAPRR